MMTVGFYSWEPIIYNCCRTTIILVNSSKEIRQSMKNTCWKLEGGTCPSAYNG